MENEKVCDVRIIDDERQFIQMGRVLMNLRLLLGSMRFYDIGQLGDITPENWNNLLKQAGYTPELREFVDTFAKERIKQDAKKLIKELTE